ncbi:LysR family transcriptional regulator [Thermomonospora amylolytica]|uniref:LysR family transcriptional regulator n=1 Tax=Thermomonospora amylolytica TaxID=1411117 RepID=UPI000E6C88C4|nr:LysR family transcriptional regulator [Thermomonospora amylolytica]
MELRDIEIFLALAEELHFGRTAERLHITPSRVSHVIKKLERRIGGPLFERTSRTVRLTPVGERLRNDLHPHYQGLQEGVKRAVLAARQKTEVLRIGMIGGGNAQDLRLFLETFADRNPGTELQIRSMAFGHPFGPLRNGEVDIAILWLPVREPDLTVGPVLFTESIVLCVPAGHPFAGRESVSYEDLADQVIIDTAMPRYWSEAVVPSRTPSGRPITVGPKADDILEAIAVVASGEAVVPVHAQTTRYFNRPDIAYVPIHDAPLAHWALIWRSDNETDAVNRFAQVVSDLGPLAL